MRSSKDKANCGLCLGIRCECVSDGWLSKTTPGTINATQICIEQGYSGDILEYGNNRGKQCNYPMKADKNSEQNERTHALESPVSWQCASGMIQFL